jgi:hypothetical protein
MDREELIVWIAEAGPELLSASRDLFPVEDGCFDQVNKHDGAIVGLCGRSLVLSSIFNQLPDILQHPTLVALEAPPYDVTELNIPDSSCHLFRDVETGTRPGPRYPVRVPQCCSGYPGPGYGYGYGSLVRAEKCPGTGVPGPNPYPSRHLYIFSPLPRHTTQFPSRHLREGDQPPPRSNTCSLFPPSISPLVPTLNVAMTHILFTHPWLITQLRWCRGE